jgi:hypothetical protein
VFVSFIERAVQDTRPDLADRGLFVTLRPISEAQRRLEKELWREFELARPRLLGALLDAVSHGLRMRPHLRVDRLPRMADFALWGAACETTVWPAGTFARAYMANRRAAIDDAIDADPAAACVHEIMAERSIWMGAPPTFCVPRPLLSVTVQGRAQAGPKILGHSPATCAGADNGPWALRFCSVAKVEQGRVIIRMSNPLETTVSTVSSVRNNGSRSG